MESAVRAFLPTVYVFGCFFVPKKITIIGSRLYVSTATGLGSSYTPIQSDWWPSWATISTPIPQFWTHTWSAIKIYGRFWLLKCAGGALLGDSGKREKKRKGEGREGGKEKESKREREERRKTVFVPSYAFRGASGCDELGDWLSKLESYVDKLHWRTAQSTQIPWKIGFLRNDQ